jgi:hypothetical protein
MLRPIAVLLSGGENIREADRLRDQRISAGALQACAVQLTWRAPGSDA